MHPDQSPPLAPTARSCHYCRQEVTWMDTYIGGHALCFDAQPVPRKQLIGEGWAPGQFLVDGKLRLVLAPLRHHQHDKRRRLLMAMTLHECPGMHRQVAS